MQQLRIHFTDSDIARTRIKLETDLLWEIVGSAQILRRRDGDLTFGPWRRQVRELAGHDPELRMALDAMVSVAPHGVGGLLATRLHRAMGVYFRSVIEPHLPTIADALCTDVAAGIQEYLHSGPEGLLGVLGPGTRWEPPVLSVDYSHQGDLHLGGRGLVLVPCYFSLRHQVALADPQLSPVLVHPIPSGPSRGCWPPSSDNIAKATANSTHNVFLMYPP